MKNETLAQSLEAIEGVSRSGRQQESTKGDASEASAKTWDLKTFLERAYPIAQSNLSERGWPRSQIEAMPRSQAVLVDVVERYELARDDMSKWFGVPYWQARDAAHAADKELAERTERQFVQLDSLLPPVAPVLLAQANRERQLAVLRCIEAIRAYAADHQGNLPDRLEQVNQVPIPVNPITGKVFPYRLDSQTAILEVEGPPESLPRQYRLRVAK